jgi:hypothetical protein
MTSRIPENPSAWFIDWFPLRIAVNTMPPRDPNDDDDDHENEDEDDKKQPDEPAVVREPDDE